MIAKSWFSRCWQWQIGGCVAIVGTLSVGVSDRVLAQIVPDNTLGAEGSVVTPDVNIQGIQSDRIDGGATRGANLFHSFQEFNVGEGRGAYFANPTGIENILTRVTGGNPSNILGRLGVLGEANLFLLNPNGIVFGQNASLDVQGSFAATTANAMQFPNGELFSASTPSAPSSLLTVNPSALFFNQVPAGAIANSSRTPVGATPAGNQFGLRVPDGRSLLLLGGDIALDGGGAIAQGGRIELGAIAGSGTVGLNVDGNDLSLSFPDGADRADISLSNGALVSVNGEGGGDIQVEGRRITLSEGSQITTVTLGAEQGGTLAVTASDAVEVIGTSANGQRFSGLFVTSRGSGDAGDLTIDTGRLLVSEGAQVSASTFGEGKGGSLQITASDAVEVIGTSANGQGVSGLFAQSRGSGDARDLTIDTGRLLVSEGAQVSASTSGEGKGGSLQITASDSVEVIGTSANGQGVSGLFAQSRGSGDARDLTIDTGRLLVSEGAQVSASTSGEGKGGNLQINASDSVELIGVPANGSGSSGLFAQSGASGEAGDLTIVTGRLLVSDGADVSVNTFGEGNGGSLQITASESVEVMGTSANGQNSSGLFAASRGSGDTGNLTIVTGSLLVSNGAEVLASTFGEGNGSSLQITASDSVEVIGTSANGQFISSLFAQSSGSGDAGDLTIDTGRLLVSEGAVVSASTFGEGKGGNLQITASDSVEVIGTSANGQRFSGLFATSRGSGDAGDLTIDTGRLLVSEGAQVSASTSGEGKGGSLQITASDSVEVIGTSANGQGVSGLFAQSSGSGDARDLTIDTRRLLVSEGAQVSASTFAQGDGGSINIFAADTVSFDSGGAFSSVARGALGNGGGINITTGSLSLTNSAALVIRTSGEGDAGSINVNAEQLFMSSNAALIGDVDPNAKGRGGNINLNVTDTILLRGGITTPTPGLLWTGESTRITIGVLPGGIGSGGTLNINADALVLADGAIVKNSTQGQGNAGNINVNARVVDISGSVPSSGLPSGLFTSTDTDGRAGDIVIDTQTFRIADGAALSARSKGDGQGGDITVNATSFEAVNGGQLVTTTFGRGQAGNIFVNATDRVTISGSDPDYTNRIAQFPNPISDFVANAITETGPNSGLFANTENNSTGNGGDIEIVTSNFNLTDSAQISASTSGSGRGGDITVNATQSLDLNQASLLAQSLAQSNDAAPAGSVTINTGNLTATNGTIATSSERSSGGGITVTADKIRLWGDSDITTNVNQGAGGGGNIYLEAYSILAFDDSDILAFARDGRGGDITLNTRAFFGENYRRAPRNTNPDTLDNNNRVDVNASGAVEGVISQPDTSFIQNSLTELPENQIDTESLLANSCIVRRHQTTQGNFTITGTGGLPQRPGDAQMSTFPTVDIETLPSDSTPSNTNPNRPWQKGDPIVEPQGVYRLPNGKLVLSRECPRIQ
jgi:filamentous hemagglutinin family protein